MRYSEIKNETKFDRSEIGFGMTQYANSDFALVGGIRSGSSNPGEFRLRYDIYSIALLDKVDDQSDANIGFTELRVSSKDGEILGLINIELLPKFRKSGYGRRVVKDIVDTTESGNLYIHDIQKKAKKFWDKLGITYTDKLNSSGYLKK